MSGINGDKSRFHRRRKHKLALRLRNSGLFQKAPVPHSASAPVPGAKKASRAKPTAVTA